MQYELLIDPRDIGHPHSMVLIALHSPRTGVAVALRSAIADTAWLDRTESQFIFGTGRDGTWLLAYLPLGAVSDLLLSAHLRGVPLTLKRLVDAMSAIEWEAARIRRPGGSGDRLPQVWASGVVHAVLAPAAVAELMGEWCCCITDQLAYRVRANQLIVNCRPVPDELVQEWAELSAGAQMAAPKPVAV